MDAALQKKARGGRPTKRTKPTLKRLFDGIKRGIPYEMCCELAGISEECFFKWRRQDPAFDAEVLKLTQESVFSLLDTIKGASQQSWGAAAFLLERRWARFYGRPETQLNLALAIQNNLSLSPNGVNSTLVVTAEVAAVIQTRAERADAVIEKLFRERNAAAQTSSLAGANGDGVREVESSLVPNAIEMPAAGKPSVAWWAALSVGDGLRPISDDAAEYVIRTIAGEVLGAQRTSGLRIELEAGDTVLRDVWSALSELTGTLGWSALVKRGEP
jgi:hypothetical protein